MAWNIEECLTWYPINPGLSNPTVLAALLERLQKVILAGVPGDIVELGCHAGDTSVFLQRMIQELSPSLRRLHLYDSFQGLPAKHAKDNPNYGEPGSVKTEMSVVMEKFSRHWLPQPHIHAGWFSEIPDDEYPEKIAFAFFDGDLYQSIWDSWVKVYPRLSPGAIVCVHDFAVSNWPGTEAACADFLADKPEKATSACFLLGEVTKR
jgi:O-methyltransferase